MHGINRMLILGAAMCLTVACATTHSPPDFQSADIDPWTVAPKVDDFVIVLDRMPKGHVGVHLVAVAPADPGATEVAALHQVGHDELGGPFGDPHLLRHIAQADVDWTAIAVEEGDLLSAAIELDINDFSIFLRVRF